MELANLQKKFFKSISRKLINEKMKSTTFSSKILGNDKLSSHQRLEIYAQQYWWRLQGCFDEDFPIIKAILGQKKYEILRDNYLYKYPSNTYLLKNLGNRLIKFVGNNKKLTQPHTKLIIDVIKYELEKIDSFDVENYSPISISDCKSNTKIKLQPHVKLLNLSFKIEDYKQKEIETNSGANLKKITNNKIKIKKRVPSLLYLLYRREGRIYYREITKNEYYILSLMLKGSTINKISKNYKIQKNSEINLIKLFTLIGSLNLIYKY